MSNNNTMDMRKIIKAITGLEDDRRISKEIVLDSLKEALEKAYRNHIKLKKEDELNVEVIINENDKKNPIIMYQIFDVVQDDEDIKDYELQIELEEALKIDPNAQVGGKIKKVCDISEFGRASAVYAKNVLKQKIREAEKSIVYDEYKDKVGDLVSGVIEAIEPKYIMVNLGNALALMPKAAQLPTEVYREGQTIRVVITSCEKETKGSQLLVSRSDAMLVKRLFEKDVPEIYQGIVEIKAIAREAGDRTKMAVISHNPDVDPIGTCVGLQGVRVNEISSEIKGERIDIFQYSDNITEFVANALKPAEIVAAVPTSDKKGIIVVVDENQLSLAIGRKGKNVRLVAKLTGKKVDIKTDEQLLDEGIDYRQLQNDYLVDLEKERKQRKADEVNELAAAAVARQQAREQEEALNPGANEIEDNEPEFEIKEIEETFIDDSDLNTANNENQEVESQHVEQAQEVEQEEQVQEPVVQEKEKVEVVEKKKKKTRTLKERSEFVSKFETFADSSSQQEEKTPAKRKKRKGEEIERKQSNAELVKDKEYSLKPFYTEEELAEIEEQQMADEDDYIDYDDYAEYYEDDQD